MFPAPITGFSFPPFGNDSYRFRRITPIQLNRLRLFQVLIQDHKIKEVVGKRCVIGILITHNHFDHVGALKDISEYYGVSIYNHNNLSEGIYSIGEFKFEVIYTPGHSADSTTYYFFEDKKMFVGDFIFRGDIGRCDLPGGDENEMLNSIIRIKEYSNCNVYPGHGEATTLDDERRSNQYFKIERV